MARRSLFGCVARARRNNDYFEEYSEKATTRAEFATGKIKNVETGTIENAKTTLNAR